MISPSTVGSNQVTTANGVRSRGPTSVTAPSTSARRNSPSTAIISPSSPFSVPSPRSPRSPSSAKVRSPSKEPSRSAPIVEAWKRTCGGPLRVEVGVAHRLDME